jgi:hypothetical protein
MGYNLPPGCTDADIDREGERGFEPLDAPTPEEERAEAWEYWHNLATEKQAENDRLKTALHVARTALLNIEQRCEKARAEITDWARDA